jgi:hypothetical protein
MLESIMNIFICLATGIKGDNHKKEYYLLNKKSRMG